MSVSGSFCYVDTIYTWPLFQGYNLQFMMHFTLGQGQFTIYNFSIELTLKPFSPPGIQFTIFMRFTHGQPVSPKRKCLHYTISLFPFERKSVFRLPQCWFGLDKVVFPSESKSVYIANLHTYYGQTDPNDLLDVNMKNHVS